MAQLANICDDDGRLSARHFYRVRSLKEIASFNIIGQVAICNPEWLTTANDDSSDVINRLGIPRALVNVLMCIARGVRKSVVDWSIDSYNNYGLADRMPLSRFVSKHGLRFKWCGIVDREEMAKLIASEEELPILERFRIACQYSLKTEMSRLWICLTPLDKQWCFDSLYNAYSGEMVRYWASILENGIPSCSRQQGLITASKLGAISSIRYFLSSRPAADKRKMLSNCEIGTEPVTLVTPSEHHKPDISGLVPFFLLQMSPRGQLHALFSSCSVREELKSDFLLYLLKWPWQNIFTLVFDFGLSSDFGEILHTCMLSLFRIAVEVIGDGYTSVEYCDNVNYIWSKLTSTQKGVVLTHGWFARYLGVLFSRKCFSCLDFILAEADVERLEELALSSQCLQYCSSVQFNPDIVSSVVKYLVPKNSLSLRLFESRYVSFIHNRFTDLSALKTTLRGIVNITDKYLTEG